VIVLKVKSDKANLFQFIFAVRDHIIDVTVVHILAHITKASAFSYVICHVASAAITSIIVA